MSQPYIDVSINEEDHIAIHYFDDSASAMQHLTLTDIASLESLRDFICKVIDEGVVEL